MCGRGAGEREREKERERTWNRVKSGFLLVPLRSPVAICCVNAEKLNLDPLYVLVLNHYAISPAPLPHILFKHKVSLSILHSACAYCKPGMVVTAVPNIDDKNKGSLTGCTSQATVSRERPKVNEGSSLKVYCLRNVD